jgi:quercetin dioxygenase-like cupin family protein
MAGQVVVAVVVALVLIGGAPAAWAQDGKPAQSRGVKTTNMVTSLGAFREAVSIPLVLTGQTVEIEPGGQTGRQRNLVPTYIYVLEGTLTTTSEGGRVGVAGVQYHAAGQSYSNPVGIWYNHANNARAPVKYLLLFIAPPGADTTEQAKATED